MESEEVDLVTVAGSAGCAGGSPECDASLGCTYAVRGWDDDHGSDHVLALPGAERFAKDPGGVGDYWADLYVLNGAESQYDCLLGSNCNGRRAGVSAHR